MSSLWYLFYFYYQTFHRWRRYPWRWQLSSVPWDSSFWKDANKDLQFPIRSQLSHYFPLTDKVLEHRDEYSDINYLNLSSYLYFARLQVVITKTFRPCSSEDMLWQWSAEPNPNNMHRTYDSRGSVHRQSQPLSAHAANHQDVKKRLY